MMDRKAILRTARPGFTLMELMVSVAILLAVLAMIGTIFTTASKAGGNATAITGVYRQLRQTAEIIRQDLERMDPGKDTLGIAGVMVQAQDSLKNPTSVSIHRADVLMLMTERRDTRTYAYQDFVDPATEFGERMQVVYGHADTARFDNMGQPIPATIKRIEGNPIGSPSEIPAYNWHLARRTVLFPTATMGAGHKGVYYAQGPLTADEFLWGQADLIAVPQITVYPYLSPGVFHYVNGDGTLAEFYLEKHVTTPFLCSYLRTLAKPPWRLYRPDVGHWYEWVGPLEWSRQDVSGPDIIAAVDPPAIGLYQGNNGLDKHFYNTTSASGNRRTIIDSTPLVGDPVRMGPQFLPNCSEFRVEYTYDDPRDVNPAHQFGIGQAGDPLTVKSGGGNEPSTFARPVHWSMLGAGEQMVWSQISAYPADRTLTLRWPTAVRVTLRAWDAGGRLEEPVTYTIVHCWPSGE